MCIIITENIEWNGHLNPQISKFSKIYYIVEALMEVRSQHAMRCICFTNFHAHLRYALI
jgi:hypothetical protein